MKIEARAPYQFRHSLEFLRMFLPMTGEQDVERGLIKKALRVAGMTVLIEAKGDQTIDLEIEADGELGDEAIHAAIDRVKFFLSLDDDLQPFYRLAEDDPTVAPIVKALHGFHQVKLATPFECTCWSILAQRCPIPAARVLKDRITERWGGAITRAGKTYRAFPAVEDLAGASPVELEKLLKNAVKARRIRSAIDAFARCDETFLRRGDFGEVNGWLRKIEGIGPWSAAFVLLRGLGRTDGLEGAGGQLAPHIAAVYGRDQVKGPNDVAKLAAKYGHQAGYWALYVRTYGAFSARAAA